MHSLIIIAHGSRRQQSNNEVISLVEEISSNPSHSYTNVKCAFLEIAHPSIPDAIIECINEGATQITVLPYFLSAGRHVAEDIPQIVNATLINYQGITVDIKPHLGSSKNMAKEILRISAN